MTSFVMRSLPMFKTSAGEVEELKRYLNSLKSDDSPPDGEGTRARKPKK
jgi:hypothetical protein